MIENIRFIFIVKYLWCVMCVIKVNLLRESTKIKVKNVNFIWPKLIKVQLGDYIKTIREALWPHCVMFRREKWIIDWDWNPKIEVDFSCYLC